MVSELNIEAIAAKLKPYVLPAAVGRLRRKKQDLEEPTSCYGGTFWGKRREAWPECNGRPMIPLVQLRSGELPVKPAALKGVALLAVFIDEDVPVEAVTGEDSSLVVREYARLTSLRPLEMPRGTKGRKHSRIEWRKVDDYPDGEDLFMILSDEEATWVEESESSPFTHHETLKIGGWPTALQVSIARGKPDNPYVMQVDSDYNHSFGDSGMLFLRRSRGKSWYSLWETL